VAALRGSGGWRVHRGFGLAGIVAVAAVCFVVLQQSGGATAQEAGQVAEVTRDDVVLVVGGVGRIVPAGAATQISVSSTAGAASGATVGETMGGAIYPGTSGRLLRFVVEPGQRVAAGQVVARLDDGGSASAAVVAAENELASARLELAQRRSQDPGRGASASAAELEAARLAVGAARSRVALLVGPRRPADLQAAQLDYERARADLASLQGSPTDRAEAISLAEQRVAVAQGKLDRILSPHAADIAAAEADVKSAEAALAALLRPPPAPAAEVVAAAEQAVAVARQNVALARAGGTPADVSAAQLELFRAQAELAALTRPAAAPAAEDVAAATAVVDSARAKRARLVEAPDPSDVAAARLELAQASADLRRLRAGPSPASLTAARTAVETARARLRQAHGPSHAADVRTARLEVARAEAELAVLRARGRPASATEIELAQLKVEAGEARLAAALLAERQLIVETPVAGTVAALLAAPGAPVNPQTPLAAVVDLEHLAVDVDLSEFDVVRLKPGMRANVSVDALGGESFPGRVAFAALSGVNSGGVVTFPVRVTIDDAEGLRPGMNVSVRVFVARRTDVLQVPLEAVSTDDEDRSFAVVLEESGEEVERRVTLGLASTTNVEVVKGLREGENVVLAETQAAQEEE